MAGCEVSEDVCEEGYLRGGVAVRHRRGGVASRRWGGSPVRRLLGHVDAGSAGCVAVSVEVAAIQRGSVATAGKERGNAGRRHVLGAVVGHGERVGPVAVRCVQASEEAVGNAREITANVLRLA